jgi:hypothetical protein
MSSDAGSDGESGSLGPGTGGSLNLSTGDPVDPGPKFTSREALNHVLDHVLDLPKDSGLRKALQSGGYFKLSHVISMPSADIQALTYEKKVGGVLVPIHLLPSEERMLKALQGFSNFTEAKLDRTMMPVDWMLVTEEEFDEYQSSPQWKASCSPVPHNQAQPLGTTNLPPTASVNSPSPAATAPPIMSEAVAFRRALCT